MGDDYALYSFYASFLDLPPYVIQTASGTLTYPSMFSFSVDGGRANVTPLTTLLLARLLGKAVDGQTVSVIPTPTDDQVAAARAAVVAYLLTRPNKFDSRLTTPIDVSAVTDFVKAPFKAEPGDAYYDAITRLDQSLMESETLRGVVEHMLHADHPAADLLSVFPLEFEANCVASGTVDPSVPNGLVHVAFMANRQIVVGPFSGTLATGDQVSMSVGPDALVQWGFSLGTNGVTLTTDATGNLKLQFQNGQFGFAECTPTVAIPISSIVPSIMAVIRLFAVTMASLQGIPPPFFCPASEVFPGLRDGPNFLLVDTRGAMYLNSTLDGFYNVHLPSMTLFQLRADVFEGPAGLRTALRGISGRRQTRDGLDFFAVSFDDTSIVSVELDTQRAQQPVSSLICRPF